VEEVILSDESKALDPWIMEEENIDRMFNFFDSREQYRKARDRKVAKKELGGLKAQIKIQEKLLNLFYREFKKSNLIKRVVAAHEIRSVCEKYCPPLLPWQVREFIVKRGSRRPIVQQLKRLKPFYGKTFPLSPLYKTIRRVKSSPASEKKEYLLIYLKHFFRYHRDLNNFHLLKEAMEAVTLVKNEKIMMLSRENRSLYEFLLPDERGKEEKQVINHVIVKADIRGSTDITYMMRASGLNPASYFSLNFFDPISEILCDYGGSKEFIEGDAIILSFVEHEGTPHGWYSVARACGLAVRMLNVVQQYNVKSQKYNLPVLELGIGICYDPKPPAFLFDGDSRIMISPAINLADRLSGCDRRLRSRFRDKTRMFNLFVFQNTPDEKIEATKDDLFPRYNVNGIELNTEGFVKLSKEINLNSVMYPVGSNEKVKLYTGKVPTLTNKYQSLVIRETAIQEVNPETMDVIGETSRKYYEVCTHPDVYEFVKNHTLSSSSINAKQEPGERD
jgi:class 3 adenylate cyclase